MTQARSSLIVMTGLPVAQSWRQLAGPHSPSVCALSANSYCEQAHARLVGHPNFPPEGGPTRRAQAGKGYAGPREALALNGNFVLSQLRRLDAASAAGARLAESGFAAVLRQQVPAMHRRPCASHSLTLQRRHPSLPACLQKQRALTPASRPRLACAAKRG